MCPTDEAFWDAVDRVRGEEVRFRREAYGFVVAALGRAAAALSEERRRDPERRHLSGRELLDAVVALGREEFGPLAATVFREWGVCAGEDVGRIVFELVGVGQLSARPEDSLDDFRGRPDLLAALGAEFPPPAPRGARRRPGGA